MEETVEKREKGEDGVVRHWLKELELSAKVEKDWRHSARNALKVYASDSFTDESHSKRKETFNILWANVETKRPSLYDSVPTPDVRRRYRDQNPIGRAVAEVLERAIDFTLDDGFDEEVIAAVNDMLLAGRAVTRVYYKPTFGDVPEGAPEDFEPAVIGQEIEYRQWQWDKFRRGPGRTWKEVPWIAFEHEFKKKTFEERWPDFADVVSYQDTSGEEGEKSEANHDKSDDRVFKVCKVWEIFDKEERKVIFIAPSYKDKALETFDDPLRLKHFFPIPKPLYAIENPVSLVPACEYTMYETLAKELERLTNRINKIIGGLRLRGVYDSTLAEIEKLFDEDDNGFVPAGDVSRAISEGGLDKAIWMLPVKEMAEVLFYLYQRREALIGEIYEITGISDIQRGDTNPNETLGAQQIKANYGSQRLSRQQSAVQRYIRDLIRITGELIAEHFSYEVLAKMTGLSFPTEQDKQAAQAQIQIMSMSGQQPPPELQQILSKPSWEQIMSVLQDDPTREFAIDIETDSTIQRQQVRDEEAITKLLTAIMSFIEGAGPAVQSGFLPQEVAKKMLMSAIRRFDLGREVEQALEEMDDMPPPQQQNDPKAEAEKMNAQVEMMRAKAEERKMQLEAEQDLRDAEYQAQAHQDNMEKLRLERVMAAEKHQMEMERLRNTEVA